MSEPLHSADKDAGPTAALNEYGTPVTAFTCRACGRKYTVCPAVPPEKWDEWENCLADACPSYDIARDIDMFFEPAIEAGLIRRSSPGDPDA